MLEAVLLPVGLGFRRLAHSKAAILLRLCAQRIVRIIATCPDTASVQEHVVIPLYR